jgi:hypothetical protein
MVWIVHRSRIGSPKKLAVLQSIRLTHKQHAAQQSQHFVGKLLRIVHISAAR